MVILLIFDKKTNSNLAVTELTASKMAENKQERQRPKEKSKPRLRVWTDKTHKIRAKSDLTASKWRKMLLLDTTASLNKDLNHPPAELSKFPSFKLTSRKRETNSSPINQFFQKNKLHKIRNHRLFSNPKYSPRPQKATRRSVQG